MATSGLATAESEFPKKTFDVIGSLCSLSDQNSISW